MFFPVIGFGPATEGEPTVYGAARPGYPLPKVPRGAVNSWVAYMQGQGMARVVCLLPERQLAAYGDLLGAYRRAFGAEHVCWAPIADFHLADEATLTQSVLPFLAAADAQGQRAVVHCSAGIGRTGHVLAAWLVSHRKMANEAAITAVRRAGRNARESGDPHLDELLDACRRAFAGGSR